MRANSDPSAFNTRLMYWTYRVTGVFANCQMPWPGVLGLVGVAEGELATNSEPSVSMTEPCVVNVASPGISAIGGVDVGGVVGVKVNCHDPAKLGVAATADMG